MQNQAKTKYSSNPEDIFKSAKKSVEKPNIKGHSSETTKSKVLNKILNRKNSQSNTITFAMLSLWHAVGR